MPFIVKNTATGRYFTRSSHGTGESSKQDNLALYAKAGHARNAIAQRVHDKYRLVDNPKYDATKPYNYYLNNPKKYERIPTDRSVYVVQEVDIIVKES